MAILIILCFHDCNKWITFMISLRLLQDSTLAWNWQIRIHVRLPSAVLIMPVLSPNCRRVAIRGWTILYIWHCSSSVLPSISIDRHSLSTLSPLPSHLPHTTTHPKLTPLPTSPSTLLFVPGSRLTLLSPRNLFVTSKLHNEITVTHNLVKLVRFSSKQAITSVCEPSCQQK